MKNETFEKKIKPALLYIGTIGAAIMVVCYIITVLILIFGFQVQVNHLQQSITFAVVNGIVGFIIMQFLKIQGIDFAKNENKDLIDKYNEEVIKKKKKERDIRFHSIGWYWFKSVVTDFLGRFLTIVATSIGLIYIVIQGSQDYSLLLLAAVNLLMFVCFGLLSLVRSYDFYSENHVNYMKHKISENKSAEVREGE